MHAVLTHLPLRPESLNDYLEELNGYPRFDRREETELARRIATGEERALQALVQSNLRLVVSIAQEYENRGAPLVELIRAGNAGLVDAAQRYRGTEDTNFVTFSVSWIRDAILERLPTASDMPVPPRARGREKDGQPATVIPIDSHSRVGAGLETSTEVDSPEREVRTRPELANFAAAGPSRGDSMRDDTGAGAPGDQLLMQRIREGCQESLGVLLRRYWGPLVGYASRFTERQDDAEDIIQEAFVRVWRGRTRWTPSGSVNGYLYRITRNLALNARRDRSALERREERGGGEILLASTHPTPEESHEGNALQREVEQALDRLPERRRDVFILSRFHGLTHQEIAEALGISKQTVANHMSSALTDLRAALSEHLPRD